MFKKILAATDLITASDAQVLTAAKVAEQNHAKLHILHVLESPGPKARVRQATART